MVEKFLSKTEFTSYEDFINNYSVNVPKTLISLLMLLMNMRKMIPRKGNSVEQ